jgi:hypothetical protein
LAITVCPNDRIPRHQSAQKLDFQIAHVVVAHVVAPLMGFWRSVLSLSSAVTSAPRAKPDHECRPE